MKTMSPPAEAVLDRPASLGGTAHKRINLYRQGRTFLTRLMPWPACVPQHQHECGNDREDGCVEKCACPCYCDLPRWLELGALRALELGATPCLSPACFGDL